MIIVTVIGSIVYSLVVGGLVFFFQSESMVMVPISFYLSLLVFLVLVEDMVVEFELEKASDVIVSIDG